jgi:uncharacterized NAD(P)/FAD-binding protein YdhS
MPPLMPETAAGPRVRHLNNTPARVAVIGGGFCGAFFAAQLARHSAQPVAITVIEPRAVLGGGVAYSTPDLAHRINVPASRMILFPEHPTDFDEWFRSGEELDADPDALWGDGSAYPRRAAFGRYVAELVAIRGIARTGITIEHIRDKAEAVQREAAGYTIQLAQGGQLAADIIVLATSHPPPNPPGIITSQLGDGAALITNPWVPGALEAVTRDADVLIIGTGLTMADVVASLSDNGHKGRITAFSRRGLLPRGHARLAMPLPYNWLAEHELPRSVLELTRLTRAQIAKAAESGLPWQAVFDDVRANGQTLWRNFNAAERRRLLRHLRVFWDAHRYRIAPQIEKILEDKQRDGSLRVIAASLVSAPRRSDIIDITLRPRRSATVEHVSVNHVVITTGPAHGTVIDTNPVLASLAEQGLLQADALGLGVEVDALGQAINAGGVSEPTLLVAGPLAREQYGELMGMPQVAAQPNAVAEHVASILSVHEPAASRSKPVQNFSNSAATS